MDKSSDFSYFTYFYTNNTFVTSVYCFVFLVKNVHLAAVACMNWLAGHSWVLHYKITSSHSGSFIIASVDEIKDVHHLHDWGWTKGTEI
jgi:hypothetical protein